MSRSEGLAENARVAIEAATRIARTHGVVVEAPVVLANAYAVRVHLKPAPIVARVPMGTADMRAPIEPWLLRELDVASWLDGQGVPVVRPSPLLPAVPHAWERGAITFWAHVEHDPKNLPTATETAGALADLHAALRGYPGELPLLGPPASDIPVGLARIEERGALRPEDLAMLRVAWDDLKPLVDAPPGPIQPLHGDAHRGNLLRTPRGLVWNDFEDVCRGPIAWDLMTLGLVEQAAVDAYPERPDPALLARFGRLRYLMLAAWLPANAPVFPGHGTALEGILAALRAG